MTAELHDSASRRLAGVPMRYTDGRRALVEIMARAGRPLTLPEILETDDDLAQSSAYRNLAELTDAGVTRRIVTGDEHVRFELAEDLTGAHHHHFVCTNCGVVEDIVLSDRLEHAIDDAGHRLASSVGHQVHAHRLDLLGLCTACN